MRRGLEFSMHNSGGFNVQGSPQEAAKSSGSFCNAERTNPFYSRAQKPAPSSSQSGTDAVAEIFVSILGRSRFKNAIYPICGRVHTWQAA
jgi:hypothetical protein